MTFNIIDNIEVPATANTRVRPRGPFATALDSLQVGQGFVYAEKRALKQIYPSIAPKKFPSDVEGMTKKFKIWQAAEGQVGVKRLADVAETNDAIIGTNGSAVDHAAEQEDHDDAAE